MAGWLVLTLAAASIVLVVALILVAGVNPAVALVVGAGALGLSTRFGLIKTATTITTGFGEIMAEVGLLIATGAIPRLVERLLALLGPRYAPSAWR